MPLVSDLGSDDEINELFANPAFRSLLPPGFPPNLLIGLGELSAETLVELIDKRGKRHVFISLRSGPPRLLAF